MHIHLDLLGGLAGDMFIAAVLDAFPELESGVLASITAAANGRGAACRLLAHRDAVLVGRRFEVDEIGASGHGGVPGSEPGATGGGSSRQSDRVPHPNAHPHPHGHPHGGEPDHTHDRVHPSNHSHTAWRSIRQDLMAAPLTAGVRDHALGIFTLLAEAEAEVHGVAVDEVGFHEVGAWDSIADIVGAAHLIDALGATRWSVSAVPLGFGRVRTAHGPMPIPAPATARLLAGFPTIDDGIGGERVTPTGAALIRYLCGDAASRRAVHPAETLAQTGIGFGTRVLPGISNCVRVMVFESVSVAGASVTSLPKIGQHRQLAVIEFEVDDQSAEDLAMGLDHLRTHADVFDVVQAPVFGKKGRMATSVRLLAAPDALDAVIEACFRETTTIGVRHRVVDGRTLPRRQHDVPHARGALRVKSVDRPGGHTAKAEADDVAAYPGHAKRQAMRARAETDALQDEPEASKTVSRLSEMPTP